MIRFVSRFHRICMVLALGVLVAPAAKAEKIVVYGASGAIGGLIVREALTRGLTVVGVVRDPSKLQIADKNFSAVAGDVTDLNSFKAVTAGADAVIISVSGNGKDNLPENSVNARAAKVAVEAFSGKAKTPHVIQIGGATTMFGTREAMLAQMNKLAQINKTPPVEPGSPAYGMFIGNLVALETYRASKIRWTVLTPPETIQGWKFQAPPQPSRTGKYRTSTTGLVLNADGESTVDIADLAVAAVDEAQQHRFVGKRFTVGY